jgi:hypothetical protein
MKLGVVVAVKQGVTNTSSLSRLAQSKIQYYQPHSILPHSFS